MLQFGAERELLSCADAVGCMITANLDTADVDVPSPETVNPEDSGSPVASENCSNYIPPIPDCL